MLKRWGKIALGCLLIGVAMTAINKKPVQVQASNVKVIVDGKEVKFDQPPIIHNDRVMVPIRAVAEQAGWEVDYDNIGKFFYLQKRTEAGLYSNMFSINDKSIKLGLFPKATGLSIFGEERKLNPEPLIQGNRTLLGIRDIAEGMYANVEWSDSTRTVTVTQKALPEMPKNVPTTKPSEEPKKEDNKNASPEKNQETMTYEEKQKKYELEIVRLVNEERKKAGLEEVVIDAKLMEVARFKAEEMKELGYNGHESPNYGAHTEFANALGANLTYAGENVYSAYRNPRDDNPEDAMSSWMLSSGHKAHILNPNNKVIGVGYSYEVNGNSHVVDWCLFMGY